MNQIIFVAAYSTNLVIGIDNELPKWNVPGDLARFKELTLNKTVVMGRNTFDSLGRKPLVRRKNIVLTTKPFIHPNITCVQDKQVILDLSKKEDIYIIGGSHLYNLFLPYCTKMHLTQVHMKIPYGTVFFPKIDFSKWKEVFREDHYNEGYRINDHSFVDFIKVT